MPVPGTLLILQPDFDLATKFCSYWMNRALEFINEKQIRTTILRGDNANPTEFVSHIEKDPASFWGAGHGNEVAYTGQNLEILLRKDVNEELMAGRVCHLLSCRTGVEEGLLESIAEKGAIACVGYAVDFIIGLAVEPYAESKITQSLCEPDSEIEKAFADGGSCVEAMEMSDNKSESWIEYWRGSGHPDTDLIIFSIISNRDAKRVYGVPEATSKLTAPPVSSIAMASFWLGVLGIGVQFVRGGG